MKSIKIIYMKIFFTFIGILFCCKFTFADGCIRFITPKPGKIITSPACTLSFESECKDISRIELQARYFTLDSDTATIVSIGTLTRAPYEFIWDISSLPNQLYAGVAFLAEVIHKNGLVEDARREGVFFAHQPVTPERKICSYDFPKSKALKGDIISINTLRDNLKINSSVYWNENDITFLINVEDAFFHSNMSKNALSEIGIEIFLDPVMSRKPYPNKDVVAFSIPLYGIPYKVSYKPAFDEEGLFRLISSSSPCNFPYSILKEDFKGYKVYFPIPKSAIGDAIPDSFACNIQLKVLNQNSQITNVSWVKNSKYDILSPYIWNTIIKEPKPFYKNSYLIWLTTFFTSLLVTLLAGFLILNIKKPRLKKAIEKTETEQKLFDNLKEAIERQVTYKNLTVDIVSRELRISPKRLTNLTKKLTGQSFQNFLMFARLEIAKERLRSSHCSASTIADACGFQDEAELEKFFLKFEHTTPSKYREKQQIT